MSDKRPLILWSGGFDSTALVIDKLHDGDVDVMYVNLNNNERAQHFEAKAIKKLKRIIADANLPGKILNEHYFGYDNIVVTKQVFAQPALWLQAATFIVNPEHHSEVALAYVKGDDIWHYTTELKNAYKALLELTCNDADVVPLRFPFEWCTKAGILDSLQHFVYYKQVMKTIRYCEGHERKPCGVCTSCQRHTSELSDEKSQRIMAIEMPVTDKVKEVA